MKRMTAMVLMLAASGSAVLADEAHWETARNPHNYTLKLDMLNWVNGDWSGDANFTITACPQKGCFHLAGPIKLPDNHASELYEGSYALPDMPCDLHFQEVPHEDMDSGDWRITPVSRHGAEKGCAALPTGLAGVYKELDGK